jgi:hypothetical protein
MILICLWPRFRLRCSREQRNLPLYTVYLRVTHPFTQLYEMVDWKTLLLSTPFLSMPHTSVSRQRSGITLENQIVFHWLEVLLVFNSSTEAKIRFPAGSPIYISTEADSSFPPGGPVCSSRAANIRLPAGGPVCSSREANSRLPAAGLCTDQERQIFGYQMEVLCAVWEKESVSHRLDVLRRVREKLFSLSRPIPVTLFQFIFLYPTTICRLQPEVLRVGINRAQKPHSDTVGA